MHGRMAGDGAAPLTKAAEGGDGAAAVPAAARAVVGAEGGAMRRPQLRRFARWR